MIVRNFLELHGSEVWIGNISIFSDYFIMLHYKLVDPLFDSNTFESVEMFKYFRMVSNKRKLLLKKVTSQLNLVNAC
jgi:hypothetical protein